MNKWKTIKKGDYLYALVPDHPNASKNGYVLEHRVIMERKIKRYLTSNEVVHHIDGNKHNNEVSNLQLMSASEHNRLHSSKGRTYCSFVCPVCGITFEKEKRQVKANVLNPKCSRRCNGTASRQIQLSCRLQVRVL